MAEVGSVDAYRRFRRPIDTFAIRLPAVPQCTRPHARVDGAARLEPYLLLTLVSIAGGRRPLLIEGEDFRWRSERQARREERWVVGLASYKSRVPHLTKQHVELSHTRKGFGERTVQL